MKKIHTLLIVSILLVLPVCVKADMLPPIGIESYANEVTVGSTVTYKIMGNVYESGKVGITNLNGKITYNASQLEYVGIDFGFPEQTEGQLPPIDVDIISNKNGVIEYKVVNEYGLECRLNLLISFKVKSLPETEKLKVNFVPEDTSITYGEANIEIEMEVLNNKNNDTIEDNSNNNNVTDTPTEEEKNDDKIDSTKENNKNTDNSKENKLYFYLMIASMCLNVIFVILIIINCKKNKMINVNKNN